MSHSSSILKNTYSLARYNMRIIFGGKFIYFILAAFIFFLVFGTIMALDNSEMRIEHVYGLLAFPAILLVFLLLFPLAGLAWYALVSYPVMPVILHLMVLVVFVSSLGFCLSTLVKNGNATAVIMVILGLFFLILSDELDESKWNMFLNPFQTPRDLNDIVWREIIRQNRLILGISSLVFLLLGLLNLQQREKFLR